MTLTELLVAMAVFITLGSTLVMFLKVGIDTWRVGEIRREAFERSQAILDQIQDDLASTYSDPQHGYGDRVDVVFLSDYDANGRQRLRFVRTLAGELRHPITQQAGLLTGGQFDYDYIDDALEMNEGLLRAPGGLQEIVYMMDPVAGGEMLWRGMKAPIGGPNTLLDEDNIYEYDDGDIAIAPRRCRPLAAGVLYIEFNFWGQETDTWQRDDADSARALLAWDSTRALWEPDDPRAYFSPSSRHEARDDIFPSRVQVILVLRPARAARLARLSAPMASTDTDARIDNSNGYPERAFQFIRIDDEWMRYEIKGPKSFGEITRGVRGTEATAHAQGARVMYGTTFSRVIRIPGARSSVWRKR